MKHVLRSEQMRVENHLPEFIETVSTTQEFHPLHPDMLQVSKKAFPQSLLFQYIVICQSLAAF
jgi:hypothetical protein